MSGSTAHPEHEDESCWTEPLYVPLATLPDVLVNPFPWRPPSKRHKVRSDSRVVLQGEWPRRLVVRNLLLLRARPAREGGYVATQTASKGFRECTFPLEELWALEKVIGAISIPMGSSCCAFDGAEGLIRVYHCGSGWIDFYYGNIEQPQWDPLLDFINEVTERFVPSPQQQNERSLFDDPEEPELARRLDDEL